MRFRLVIGLLVLINVSLAAFIGARHYIFPTSEPIPVAQSHELPLVQLRDDTGRVFSTAQFMGTPLFVQFVHPHIDAHISSFLKVRSNRPRKPVSWMLLTLNARELRSRLPSDSDDVVIVDENHEALRNLFSLSRSREHWVIFDESSKYRESGSYDMGDAANKLRNIVDNVPIYSTQILSEILTLIDKKGQLSQLHASAAKSASGKTIVGMFSTACTACLDGSLVDLLNTSAAQDRKNSFVIIVPNTFSTSDMKNFKANLELSIPVFIANEDFSREWSALNEQYGERAINGSVFVVDQKDVLAVVNGISETKRLLKDLTK